ncbi:MAG TPA: beta-ketoacyl-ACP synthase III [Oscillatoriaceae cyanobacterium]
MPTRTQPVNEPTTAVRTIPVRLTGVGHAVPEAVLSNADLERLVETSDEWIFTRTGIRERRVLAEPLKLHDLCVPAARRALDQAAVDPRTLDLIIVATSSPDHPMPSNAALLQAELGACNAAAFDLEAACSGYVYALTVARQFIATGMYRRVLVVGADMLSRYMDYTDRGTCILFGDGAGATVLEAAEDEGLLAMTLAADGRGACHLDIAPNPNEPEPPGRMARRAFMHMNGKEIYRFVMELVPKAIEETCAKAGLAVSDIDYFLLHQANARILEAVCKRLNVPAERMLHNIANYGNTSAASIPILLAESVEAGTIRAGHKICMVGFGAGLTWGCAVAEWTAGR